MDGAVIAAITGAGGLIVGSLITSAFASRSSESGRLQELVIARDKEIIELRKVMDRRHTHLSAYARTLEIVLLAWRLPSLEEQIETIRSAKEHLEKSLLGGHGAG